MGRRGTKFSPQSDAVAMEGRTYFGRHRHGQSRLACSDTVCYEGKDRGSTGYVVLGKVECGVVLEFVLNNRDSRLPSMGNHFLR